MDIENILKESKTVDELIEKFSAMLPQFVVDVENQIMQSFKTDIIDPMVGGGQPNQVDFSETVRSVMPTLIQQSLENELGRGLTVEEAKQQIQRSYNHRVVIDDIATNIKKNFSAYSNQIPQPVRPNFNMLVKKQLDSLEQLKKELDSSWGSFVAQIATQIQ